jgi:hypothetical protein
VRSHAAVSGCGDITRIRRADVAPGVRRDRSSVTWAPSRAVVCYGPAVTARRPRRTNFLSFSALASPVVLTMSIGGCKDGTGPGSGTTDYSVCNVVCEPVTSTATIESTTDVPPASSSSGDAPTSTGDAPTGTGATGTGTTTTDEGSTTETSTGESGTGESGTGESSTGASSTGTGASSTGASTTDGSTGGLAP